MAAPSLGLAVQALPLPGDLSSTLACLQVPAQGIPPGPREAASIGAPTTRGIQLRLRFTDGDAAPDIHVVREPNAAAIKVDALRYASGYRLPCLSKEAAAVSATQQIGMLADGRVWYGSLEPDPEGREARFASCLAHDPRGANWALDSPQAGRVLMRLTFQAPDAPPSMEVVAGSTSNALRRYAQRVASINRLPCISLDESPYTMTQWVYSVVDRDGGASVKNMNLQQLLGSVKGLQDQHVRFDLNTMRCPFDLRVILQQPYLRNEVSEVETSASSRREFIAWIRSLELALPERTLQSVIGSEFLVAVPCGVVDLLSVAP